MRDDVQDMIQDLFDDGYMIDVQDDIDLSLLRIVHAMATKLKQQERSLNVLGNMPDRVRSMQDALVQHADRLRASDRLNAQLDTKVGEINSHPPGLDAEDIAKGQELKAGLEAYAARSIEQGKRLTKLETSDDEHRKAHDLLTEWSQYVEEKLNAVHKEVSQTRKDIDTLYGYSDRSDTVYALHDTSLQTLHATVKEQGERLDVLAERLRTQHERQDALSSRLSELETKQDVHKYNAPAGPIPPVTCDAAQQNSEEWPPKPAFRDTMTKLERESIQLLRNIVDRDILEYGPKSGPRELSPDDAQRLRKEINQLRDDVTEAIEASELWIDSQIEQRDKPKPKPKPKPKWNPAVHARPAPSEQDMDDELDTTG